jgi:hypothetical protein
LYLKSKNFSPEEKAMNTRSKLMGVVAVSVFVVSGFVGFSAETATAKKRLASVGAYRRFDRTRHSAGR